MFDIQLRELKDKILSPLATALKDVPPNNITIASLVAGLLAALAAGFHFYKFALFLWAINRFTDGLDGMVARQYNRSTDFGAYLDIIVDFTVYSTIPYGIAFGRPSTATLLTLGFMLSTFFVNAAGLFYLSAI
eukprot:Colp12_sorted_trinity150504_noHs@1120